MSIAGRMVFFSSSMAPRPRPAQTRAGVVVVVVVVFECRVDEEGLVVQDTAGNFMLRLLMCSKLKKQINYAAETHYVYKSN
jgi:hypothetical protein